MTTTTNTMDFNCTASCPFCPLADQHIDICNVRLFWSKNEPPRVQLPADLMEEIYSSNDDFETKKGEIDFLERNFTLIALMFRNNQKVTKKGDCATRKGTSQKGNKYSAEFEVIAPNYYKVCFHAQQETLYIDEMD